MVFPAPAPPSTGALHHQFDGVPSSHENEGKKLDSNRQGGVRFTVRTLHETPKKPQIPTTATIILNRPAPGHNEKGPCDKGTRGRYSTRPDLSQGRLHPWNAARRASTDGTGALQGTLSGRRLMVRARLRTGGGGCRAGTLQGRPPFINSFMEGLWWGR